MPSQTAVQALDTSSSSSSMAVKGEQDEEAALLHRDGRAARPSMATQLGRYFSLRSGTARVLLAAMVSIAWMFFSSMLILLNKHILKDLKFP